MARAGFQGERAQPRRNIRVMQHIGECHQPAFADGQLRRCTGDRPREGPLRVFQAAEIRITDRADMQMAVISRLEHDQLGRTEEVFATLQDAVEHRLGVGHRIADHLQHFADRRLVFQCLASARRCAASTLRSSPA
jgi:hypothetical protein